MNLVFLNSMEKQLEEGRTATAQVSICEQQGKWFVLWNEPDDSGTMRQSVWFEGDRWDDMLAAFRREVAHRLAAGYVPLLDQMTEPALDLSEKAKAVQRLLYYAERHADAELFEKLRAWRRETAALEGRAPYHIATNRILHTIAAYLPLTKEELIQLPGFGEKKAEKYGNAIFAITKLKPRRGQFPLDWVDAEIDEQQFSLWLKEQRHNRIRTTIDRQEVKRAVLETLDAGGALEQMRERTGLTVRELMPLLETIASEGYDLDPLLEKELSVLPEEERNAVQAAFHDLGDKLLKPIFKQVYNELPLKPEEVEQKYTLLRFLRMQLRSGHAAVLEQAG